MATELHTLPLPVQQFAAESIDEDLQLLCVGIRTETHDVKTFTFASSDGRPVPFEAGQYIRFEVQAGNAPASRCYSLSSSPCNPQRVSITVKRVAGGLVSNWLHEHLVPGSVLQGTGPMGTFTLPRQIDGPLLLVSGGSGITPVMSMLRGLADAHRHPDIVFLHAARTPADLVFKDELEFRARVTPGLRVVFLPDRVESCSGFTGIAGRISHALFEMALPDIAQRTVMCCGPAPFMQAVRQICATQGVPPERYFEESFGSPVPDDPVATTAPRASDIATYQVSFAKQKKTLGVANDQTVLAAARKSGLRMPSSCGNGVCGTCKSKLISGSVDMKHGGGIRQREIDAGFFLPCCSKPQSDLVIDS